MLVRKENKIIKEETAYKDGGVLRFSLDNVLGNLQISKAPSYSDEKYNIFLNNVFITVYDRGTPHKLNCWVHIHLYSADVRQCLNELSDSVRCSMCGKVEVSKILPYIGKGVTLVCNNSDFYGNDSIVSVNDDLELDSSKVTFDFKDSEILNYL